MLEPAIKYADQLNQMFIEIAHDPYFKYLYFMTHRDKILIQDSNWDANQFVSVHNGAIIGFFHYQTDRVTYDTNSLMIVNFTKQPSIIFAKDLAKMLSDIFLLYNFRKLSYTVLVGNPIEASYDRMTEEYGGRIVGTYKQEVRISDGSFCDKKIYEIMREDFVERYADRRTKKLIKGVTE